MGTGLRAYRDDIEFGDAKARDEVYMLFEISLLVTLRRIGEQQLLIGAGGNRYNFVGPRYLYGEISTDGNVAVEEICCASI